VTYSKIPANTSTPLSSGFTPTARSSCADAHPELRLKILRRVSWPGVFSAAVSDADARALASGPAALQ